MNTILIEPSNNPLGNFHTMLRARFPSSSIVYCHKDNLDSVRDKIALPPIYTPGWIIIVNIKNIDLTTMESFESEYDQIFYKVENRDAADILAATMTEGKLSYTVTDNSKPSEDIVINYIKLELKVTDGIAESIYKRCRGNLSRVKRAVDTLYGKKVTTVEMVKRYVDAHPPASYQDLFDYIIGNDCRVSKSEIFGLVNQYRYGIKYLIRFILKEFEFYLKIHQAIAMGDLSIENLDAYKRENNSEFKKVSSRQMERAVRSYSVVSTDKLYYLYWEYKRTLEGYKLIPFLMLLNLSDGGKRPSRRY